MRKLSGSAPTFKGESHGLLNDDGSVAHALVVSGWIEEGSALLGLTINVSSGVITNKVHITQFRDEPDQESTRPFLWDRSRAVFWYLDSNFTQNGGVRPKGGRKVILTSVDASTGDVNSRVVEGAIDFPTGYAMKSDGTLLMACEAWSADGTSVQGFQFYDVDLDTAVASPRGPPNKRGSGESSAEYYAGYHRAVAGDDATVFRMGYQFVTQQNGQGIGVTKTDSSSAPSTSWKSEVTKGHDYFMTLDVHGNNFLSLAPNASDPNLGLDLIEWSLDESVYNVVASLGNAHPPRTLDGGNLGYLATDVSSNGIFGGLVEYYGPPSPTLSGDKWCVASVDPSSGAYRVMPLTPNSIAGTWSLSGFGLL